MTVRGGPRGRGRSSGDGIRTIALGASAVAALAGLLAIGARLGHASAASTATIAQPRPALSSPALVSVPPAPAPVATTADTPHERFTVEAVNTGKSVEVVLSGPGGEPDEASYRALRHELRAITGAESPIDPRLVELLHRIAKATKGTVQVVSAFRPPKSGRDHNFHTRGMAADVRVPGMRTTTLRDLARAIGAHGIGFYPTSQFVHIDVREEHYEWTDTSGPGQDADDAQSADHEVTAAASASAVASSGAPPLTLTAALRADAGSVASPPLARGASSPQAAVPQLQ
jgi:uncharacterized protein YcbK (DUF882 family)